MTRDRLFSILISIVSVAITVVAVDLIAYFLVPDRYTDFLPKYKTHFGNHASVSAIQPTRQSNDRPLYARGYPRHYFEADEKNGFDIRKNVKSARHQFEHGPYEIFSNEFGCFDKNDRTSLLGRRDYVYFAGDSFTWGYARYESKFPTIYERLTGIVSLKCGVTHTGQRHQYRKFRKIVKSIGSFPKRVFVGYYENDIANDYAHPHTTVIGGFQIDTIGANDENALVTRNLADLRTSVNAWIAEHDQGAAAAAPWSRGLDEVGAWLGEHSLTTSLLMTAAGRSFGEMAPDPVSRHFYSVMNGVHIKTDYATSEIAEKNRQAIRRWMVDSHKNGYELVFILIPPMDNISDTKHFKQLKEYISALDGSYVDLSEFFEKNEKESDELYWKNDGHLNEDGNAFVGELLAKMYP